MSVIVLANPKGGVGKSTAAVVLGTTLASRSSVTLVDCDPNQPLVSWSRGASRSLVRVLGGVSESEIVTRLDTERRERQFVIVDLEGAATRMVSRAIARADLVLIPMQASAVDAAQAARAVGLVQEEEQVLGRSIPIRIVLTRTNPAIPTRAERAIVDELRSAGVPILATHLHHRTAFQQLFAFKATLGELDPAVVNGLEAAKVNAAQFATEVVALVTKRKAAA